MTYCNICKNKELCEKYSWVVTMDRQRILAQTGEYLCDNFITDENIVILYNTEVSSDINKIDNHKYKIIKTLEVFKEDNKNG